MTQQQALVVAMAEPGFYPERPARVEVRESHISWVFLAGDHVYKLKKPVRFEFLDYSTRERRRFFCEEEVRLNRRLAPSVYLGVVPILRAAAGFVLGEEGARAGAPEVVDHVVKMRRLPQDRMLDRMLREGRAGADDVARIVERLVAFHRSCPASSGAEGSVAAVREIVEENLRECTPFIPELLSHRDLHEIQEYTRAFLAREASLVARRAAEGRVREGHGDLRAEHICLADGIDVFDCVEFSRSLRTCDVAAEIAFLAMDLDFLGFPPLADSLAAGYAASSGDRDLPALLPFYKSYRAQVRGKVDGLRSRLEGLDPEETRRARQSAERHFLLALRYSREPLDPRILVVCGLSGTGKSTVAAYLGDLTGFAVVSSDAVRKDLAGVPRTARPSPDEKARLYDAAFTARTYGELLRRAEAEVRSGRGVIVDATFQSEEHRRWFAELGARCRVPTLFVECRADEREIARRLREREREPGVVSDATWEVYLRQRRDFAPFIEGAAHRALDTGPGLPVLRSRVDALLHGSSDRQAP
jgi:uncharacterized protein